MDQDEALSAAIKLGYDIDRLATVVGMHRPDGSSRKMDAGRIGYARACAHLHEGQVGRRAVCADEVPRVFAGNINASVPLGAKQV